jgi:FkbM family methyltransferase
MEPTLIPSTPGDEALLREFAQRLSRSSDEDAAALLARLVEQLRVEAVGMLMEKLPPVWELDYASHPIKLLVSSSEIGLRLISVEKEPFTVEWIERSIKPGDVFYDIGANVGAYSLIAAKATRNAARVFAFEPAASSFHDLTRNVLLNDCAESVVPLPFALWSDTGPLSFASTPPVAGAAQHHISRHVDSNDEHAVTILGIRLDDLVERIGLPVPTHAKIDTDGYELDVLQGAERTLARPEWRSIIVELDRGETNRNREIKKLLANVGFDTGRRHERLPTPNFPQPEGRPDIYWTFTRPSARTTRATWPRPLRSGRLRSTPLRRVQRQAVTATLAVVMFLFLLLVFLPEQLGDRPYDVFGLKF